MTVFEIITLVLTSIGMILGGGWAILSSQAKLKERLDKQKIESLEEMVKRVEKSVDTLSDKVERLFLRMEAMENRFNLQLAHFSEKLHVLRVTLEQMTIETLTVKKDIAEGARALSDSMKRVNERSKIEDLGNGYVRIPAKKKTTEE